MIAARCRAVPWPASAALSARASACFTVRILLASDANTSASRSRLCRLISLIERTTPGSMTRSTTNALWICHPNCAICCLRLPSISVASSSCLSKSSSSVMAGILLRAMSVTYESSCSWMFSILYIASWSWSAITDICTSTCMVTNVLSLVLVLTLTVSSCTRLVSDLKERHVPKQSSPTTANPGLSVCQKEPKDSTATNSSWATAMQQLPQGRRPPRGSIMAPKDREAPTLLG
mmetsp:Transcript_61446/g.180306  ORF Transcript_61446/g.180306 Transcript_61446/m.180306 type:complete len:234 (+) Transcript_61446:134-835(+)